MDTEKLTKSDELTRNDDRGNRESQPNQNIELFRLSLRSLSNITLILPLSGLFICFVTGYIFQAEEIHETHCRVSILIALNHRLCSQFYFFYPYFYSVSYRFMNTHNKWMIMWRKRFHLMLH